MCRLNRNAAKLMHKYGMAVLSTDTVTWRFTYSSIIGTHASTDVTGFGILGHAQNLASNQTREVDFIIDTFPVIDKMWEVNAKVNFKLEIGKSAETSGISLRIPGHHVSCFADDWQLQ